VFLVGTGRCGSTFLHQLLAHHPQVAVLTNLAGHYPAHPAWNRWGLRLAHTLPFGGAMLIDRMNPHEHYNFWEYHARGLSRPFRDLGADDVRPMNRDRLHCAIGAAVPSSGCRFVAKFTGWPRLGFLASVFPDARFIEIIRDGRAVANSFLNVDFWDGWRGPDQWAWGRLPDAYRREWRDSGQSFVVLAGIQWKMLMDAFERARPAVTPSHLLVVRYEELVADPPGTLASILRFCRLEESHQFDATVRQARIEDCNFKWKQDLSPAQQELLQACLADHLRRYGYSP
jgi:hypothetical protein